MKINKRPLIWQLIQSVLLILTFTLLFGKHFGLKVSSVFGILTYVVSLFLSIIVMLADTKELATKMDFLPMEITTFFSSGVILFVSTIFLIVYFLIEFL